MGSKEMMTTQKALRIKKWDKFWHSVNKNTYNLHFKNNLHKKRLYIKWCMSQILARLNLLGTQTLLARLRAPAAGVAFGLVGMVSLLPPWRSDGFIQYHQK